MGHPLVLVPVTGLTSRQQIRRELVAYEDRGRPTRRVPGGWLTDQAELKKFITLCDLCVGKWNPKKYGYERWHQPFYRWSIARCLGCNDNHVKCQNFVHGSEQTAVGHFSRRSGKGRWGMGH
mgnify:CR=1 FL=1